MPVRRSALVSWGAYTDALPAPMPARVLLIMLLMSFELPMPVMLVVYVFVTGLQQPALLCPPLLLLLEPLQLLFVFQVPLADAALKRADVRVQHDIGPRIRGDLLTNLAADVKHAHYTARHE